MRWSDDKLKSNYHRVRMPVPGEDQGSRYSIAYFNQVSIFSEEPEDGSCCFSCHRLAALDGGSSVVTVLQPPVRCFVSPDWQSQKLKHSCQIDFSSGMVECPLRSGVLSGQQERCHRWQGGALPSRHC